MRQEQQAEERVLILQYEAFRQELARQAWKDLSEDKAPQSGETETRPAARELHAPSSLRQPDSALHGVHVAHPVDQAARSD